MSADSRLRIGVYCGGHPFGMQLTDHHAKYFAYELTRRWPPDSIEKLTEALVDAQVDLNPHQIDAALFAFRSPLSKGAVLADEVGLGKTIEAGPSPVAESVVRCLMPKIRWTGKGIA